MNLVFWGSKAGRHRELGDALGTVIDPTRREAGCLSCNLYQSVENPDLWLVFEDWRSQEYLEAHLKTSHMKAFLRAVPRLVEGDLDRRMFLLVSPLPPTADTSSSGSK